MLLWDKCGHLFLDGGHLFIKLPQPPHEVTVTMDLGSEGAVFNAGYGCVHFRELVPSGKELFQILDRIQCSVIETGRCMDFSSVRRTVRREFSECIGIGCHEHRHVFGRDSTTVFVGDVEWNIIVLVIPLIPFRDRGLTSLDSYTPLIPQVVQPDRAVFCFSHTVSTSSSPPSSATWAHPLGILATSQYFLGIFTVFVIQVAVFFVGIVFFGVGSDVRSERYVLRLPSCNGSGFPCN